MLPIPNDEDFLITYKGAPITVSPVLNKGNIFFIVHMVTDVVIAEGMVNEEWVWYEAGKGETPLAAELGLLIEETEK